MLVAIGLVLSLASSASPRKHTSSVLPQVWNDVAMQYLEKERWNPGCKDCKRIKQILELRHPELNLTDVRLEMAKQDILRKLGMTAPPNHDIRLSSLPVPIAEGSVFTKYKDRSSPEKLQAETTRVFSFASDITCTVDPTTVNLKLNFHLPEQARKSEKLISGKLWLYSNQALLRKGGGILSSKPCGLQNAATIKTMPISLQPKGGWLEMEVTSMLEEKEECFSFKIAWPADVFAGVDCSSYINTTTKPFLLMDVVVEEIGDVFRGKRNVNCATGITDCCREKLYISFADIGWDNWIIQPKGYDAYYCKGTCANLGALSLGATPYHSVIKKLSLKNAQMLDFTPCCTPTTLSAVQLIYVKDNTSVVEKTIPNLTVETCGCM